MKIKINRNCYLEFSSMMQTCAHNSEDEAHDFLWTALENAKYVGGKSKAVEADLTPQQIKLFVHFIQNQMEYMSEIVLWQMKDDGDTAKNIRRIKYDIDCLGKLMAKCEEMLVA